MATDDEVIPEQIDLDAEVDNSTIEYSGSPKKLRVKNFSDLDFKGALGEIKQFALSITGAITKSILQSYGWIICDGSTPASQGITDPDITVGVDLRKLFIRNSNTAVSGATGGSTAHSHLTGLGKHSSFIYVDTDNLVAGTSPRFEERGDIFSSTSVDAYNIKTDDTSTLPSFYELVFFMKVKTM